MKYNNSALHTDPFFLKLTLSLLVKLFAILQHLIPLGVIIRRLPIPLFDEPQCKI